MARRRFDFTLLRIYSAAETMSVIHEVAQRNVDENPVYTVQDVLQRGRILAYPHQTGPFVVGDGYVGDRFVAPIETTISVEGHIDTIEDLTP